MKLFGFEIKRSTGNQVYDPTRNLFNISGVVGRTPVTEKTALSLSAYWAGVKLISETIANLPVDVVKKEDNRRIQVSHPSEYLLNAEANYKSISFDFIQILVTSAINHGNGLALIERDQFANPTALINVRKDYCEAKEYDGEIWWKVKIGISETDSDYIMVNDRDMINLRAFGTHPVNGLSAIAYHKQNLGLSLAAQDYGQDFYNKGTRIDGYLKFNGVLDKERRDKIGQSWLASYGPNGTNGTAVLDDGVDYVKLGLSPEDAQFIETRKFQKNEIATILGVPAHMINELENATFSNIEHQQIEFITYAIGTWIGKLEQEYRRKLLRDIEKPDHVFKHNLNSLLRTDLKSQAEHFRIMTEIGAYSINDVRALIDLNPVDNGDERYIQINKIPISQIEDYYKLKGNEDNKTSRNKGD